MELGNDEAYYWLYSQWLQWNYFDHPPLVALWVRLFTFNLHGQDYEGLVRLGSVLGGAASSWFLYKAVSELHSPKAGWLAACLYHASFYAGITAGLFIMPDSPQMVFWTFSLWMLARICTDDRPWTNWLLLGTAAGLCIMSKVHGVFIWVGLGAFLLLKKRNWLTNPRLYAALLLTVLIASPILLWNIRYEFITYRFHSERVITSQFPIDLGRFLGEVAGQIAFNNPFNVALIVAALVYWRRRRLELRENLLLFALIGLPLPIILLYLSLYRDTMIYWSGPGYVALLPLAAIHLAESTQKQGWPRLHRWSLGTFFFVLTGWALVVHLFPGTWGSKKPQTLGEGDLSLDVYGWRQAGERFGEFYRSEVARGLMPAGAPLVCYKWWGAHIEYYFGRPLGTGAIGLGSINNLHHYLWLNARRQPKVNLSRAYCIVPSDETYDVARRYSGYYRHISLVKVISILRRNAPAHNFYVYRLMGWKNQLPVVH
ncbi:glycosyltransferase family 39 protein [Paraflavisolibacter sp. H34]|uniref:ArnT family glycosyltransferase n=1 Tax=Huijunlia imazamoxiresistens TaxID=3127457 RepID=UPI003016B40E